MRRLVYLVPIVLGVLSLVSYLASVVYAPIPPIPWDQPSAWSGFTAPTIFLLVATVLSLVVIGFLRLPPRDKSAPTEQP